MNRKWFVPLLLVAAEALVTPARAADPVAVPISLGPGSSLWLDGTSTMHDFECRSKEVRVTLTRDEAATPPADGAGLFALMSSSGVRGVTVTVPVVSLLSGKDGLDKNLRKTMLAAEHPDVRFQLTRHTVTSSANDTLRIHAEGSLTVAGQTQPIDLEARAWRGDPGVWLEGQETVLISHYGMKPPRMMMGTLKVGDPVQVHYRLLLVPTGEPNGSPAVGRN